MPEENAKDQPDEEQPLETESEASETEVAQEAEIPPDVETSESDLESELQESPETETQIPPPSPQPISPSSEHNWSMIAHLSIFLNTFSLILGPIVALIIYLAYKDRSRYIAYQSLQALIFQLITWIGAGLLIGVIWLVTTALSIVLVGLLCIPFALLATFIIPVIPFAALIYGVIAGIKCSQGEDFRYWLIGDWVRDTYVGA